MASWAEDQERFERYDEALRAESGFMPENITYHWIEDGQTIVTKDVAKWRAMLDRLPKVRSDDAS